MEKLQYGIPHLNRETFQNPPRIVRPEENDEAYPLVNPDPYVLKYNGVYYSYATGATGVLVMKSDDLCEWVHEGYALRVPDQKDYWAPAVYYENGLFYMYYSSMGLDEHDPHFEQMKVAVSEQPQGPFRYVKTLFDTFSIDAHVVRDRDGELYLFYSTNDVAGTDSSRPGTVILADRLLDMYTPAGEPKLIVKPTIEEEVFEKNRFGDGRDWHTIEGAFYLHRRGKSYCLYSGNAYLRPHYFLGYSVAEGDTGLADLNWTKEPNEYTYAPLMKRNDFVLGTGHNSVVKAPNLVDNWIVYHGVDVSKEADMHREHRQLRIDPLLWKGDKMWVPGPSYDMQARPAAPSIRDLFRAPLSGQRWQAVSGSWEVEAGELQQTAAHGKEALLLREGITDYLCEVSLKWNKPVPSHLGGRYGVYLSYENEKNYAELLLHVGLRQYEIAAVTGGIRRVLQTGPLPKEFRFDTYHCLTIQKQQGAVTITLDDRELAQAAVPVTGGAFGLVTYYTAASYAGFSLTKHQEWVPGLLEEVTETGGFSGNDSALLYEKDEVTGIVLLKEPFGPDYTYSVDIQANSRAGGCFGLYAAYENAETYVQAAFDEAKRHITITRTEAGTVLEQAEIPYPDELQFAAGHTVLVQAAGGNVLILLDEYLVWSGTGRGTKIGLFANMKTSFTHMTMTAAGPSAELN